jgi:hypothetical protein
MYSLVLLAALVPAAPEPDAPSGTPPVQMLASIDGGGKLTLTYVGCYCDDLSVPEIVPPALRGDDKAPAPPKVKVKTVTVTTAELAAKHVQVYTADGRPVAADKLASLLARERTVLVVLDGKKVDPFFLQLYKADTLVLVPPAHTINIGFGGYYGAPAMVVPAPPGRPLPVPEVKELPPDKAPRDGRKPLRVPEPIDQASKPERLPERKP